MTCPVTLTVSVCSVLVSIQALEKKAAQGLKERRETEIQVGTQNRQTGKIRGSSFYRHFIWKMVLAPLK